MLCVYYDCVSPYIQYIYIGYIYYTMWKNQEMENKIYYFQYREIHIVVFFSCQLKNNTASISPHENVNIENKIVIQRKIPSPSPPIRNDDEDFFLQDLYLHLDQHLFIYMDPHEITISLMNILISMMV